MSKKQLEEKYNITIDEKDKVFFVFSKKTNILLFLAPNLSTIDKSMQYIAKNEI